MATVEASGRLARLAVLLLVAHVSAGHFARAEEPLPSQGQIEIDESNPLGHEWLLKIQSNTYWLDAHAQDTHRIQEKVQLQPRLSAPIARDLFLIARPTLVAFESTPYQTSAGSLARAIGFGDIEVPLALAPTLGPSWILGVGPTFALPTATSERTGQGKWQTGPAAVLGWTSSEWLVAFFGQQFWSFAGSGQRKDVSRLKVQYFLSRYLPGGWSVGMSPTVTVNWKAEGGQQLTFPVGLGIGKVLRLSDRFALKLSLQLEYMPIHPDALGQEANVQVTVTPVLPQPFARP